MFCNKVEIETDEVAESMTLEQQFFIKDGEACFLVKLADVQMFQSVGNYTRVFFNEKNPMTYRIATLACLLLTAMPAASETIVGRLLTAELAIYENAGRKVGAI